MHRHPRPPFPDGCGLVLLSGGSSRRLGRDKATAHVGGERLLDRLLAQVPPAVPTVLVGPVVEGLPPGVEVVREDPPGSGPLAGIAVGVARLEGPLVGVLAADMPFAVPLLAAALTRLAAAHGEHGIGDGDPVPGVEPPEAVVPVDAEGHPQVLCAAYRRAALRTALDACAPLAGRPVRALLGHLAVMEWPSSAADLVDVDTEERLRLARARAAAEGIGMEQWIAALSRALGVEGSCDVDVILDVARDAAHAVARPAAPVTTYLLGLAVAAGSDPAEAAARISALARDWPGRDDA